MKVRIVLLAAVAALTLVACGAPAAEPTKAPAGQATAAGQPTRPPGAPATATPSAAAPKKGGKVTMAVWQSPVTLNPLLGSQTVQSEVNIFVIEGMTKVLGDGSRVPSLAKRCPPRPTAA